MINYFGVDTKRIFHALKVHSFARMIARNENLSADLQEVIEIVALLHDIGIKNADAKYGSTDGKYQEIEGPSVANALLSELAISNQQLNRILFIIGNHHSYSKIDGIDFQIIVEADFIVNIEEERFEMNMISSIRNKYFCTKTGLWVLDTLYKT